MRPLPASSILHVSPSDTAELLAAAASQTVYDDLAYYDPEVPLSLSRSIRAASPEAFNHVVHEMRARLCRSPYCVIVRGLHFDAANRLYIGLVRAMGNIISPPYKEPRARFIHAISPGTDLVLSGSVKSQLLHTDGADWPQPPGIVTMLCKRQDPLCGGNSRLLVVESLREEIKARMGEAALHQLETESLPWQLAYHFGSEVVWSPVLPVGGVARWRRYTIDAGCTQLGIELSPANAERLDVLAALIENTNETFEFLLQPGDFLVFDNLKTLHGRTALSDHPSAQDRLMYRNWIQAMELPHDAQ